MSSPEKLSSMTAQEAEDFLVAYDKAYDELDGQGQNNPILIRSRLADSFFKGVAYPERELLRLRNLAATLKNPDSPEISAVVKGSADSVEAIVSAPKPTLSELAKPVDALREKTRAEAVFEDFEAAYAMQTANGDKPEYVTFETVVDFNPRSFKLPHAVAKSIMIPPARFIRVMSLQRLLFPGEAFE